VAFIPAVVALIGAAASAIGKHKQAEAQKKAELEKAQLGAQAASAGWDQKEQSRIAILKSLQAQGGAHGPKVQALLQGLDPSLFNARPYAGPAAPTETGISTAGDILSGAGQTASAAADFYTQKAEQDKRDAEQQKFLCAVYPTMCQQGQVNSKATAPTVGSSEFAG
jgi:hypothetical protein